MFPFNYFGSTAGVLTLSLNRPEKLNALTHEIYQHVNDAVSAAAGDDACHGIVLKGNGRTFSSGFDLSLQLKEQTHAERLRSLRDVADRARWAIGRSSKPVVAAVHGYCLGGAFELTPPCDFAIATEDCRLGEPEILFGAAPVFLMVPWMTGHKRAKDVLLTGRHLSAAQALDMGLVTRVVPPDALSAEAERLLDTLRGIPAPALSLNKRGINRAYEAMGMAAHIESWGESAAYLSFLMAEAGGEFPRILEEQGTAAALRWREERFAADRNREDPAS